MSMKEPPQPSIHAVERHTDAESNCAEETQRPGNPIHVLLVEDEPGDACLVQASLRSSQGARFEVTWVTTLAETLQRLADFSFDALLLDLSLPDSIGLDTLQAVHRATGVIPVIVLTGQSDIDFALQSLDAGAADYLVKGDFGYEDLARAIRYAMHRAELETGLRENATRLNLSAQVVASAAESILVTDPNGIIESVNPAFTEMTGYSAEEAVGNTPRILNSGIQDSAFYEDFWRCITTTGGWQGEMWNRRKDGRIYPQWLTVRAVRDESGVTRHFVSIASDLTAIRRAESEVARLAHFDPLTGLPNRDRFKAELDLGLVRAQQMGQFGAVALLNLRRFREVNEALGFEAGDLLLKRLAQQLAQHLSGKDHLARVGADEFAMILVDLGAKRDDAARRALTILEHLLDVLRQPLAVTGEDYLAEAHVGVTLFPGAADVAPDVLRETETALRRVKQGAHESIAFFDTEMGDAARGRFNLEQELRYGITTDELRLFLQPQIDNAGNIAGFEALVRWQHPSLGLVPPGQFIPIAEDGNLIVSLDEWMLEQTCRLIANLTNRDHAISVSVNLSPRNFARDDLTERINRYLEETGANPGQLILEVTEGLFLHNTESAANKMRELAAHGIRFSLDDFGTGYSALSYLKKLPFHELKIDQSFIRDLPGDPDDVALVETILSVARHLKLHVVAEGVETAEQSAFLRSHGEVIQQGYLHGRPEPAQNWLSRLDRTD